MDKTTNNSDLSEVIGLLYSMKEGYDQLQETFESIQHRMERLERTNYTDVNRTRNQETPTAGQATTNNRTTGGDAQNTEDTRRRNDRPETQEHTHRTRDNSVRTTYFNRNTRGTPPSNNNSTRHRQNVRQPIHQNNYHSRDNRGQPRPERQPLSKNKDFPKLVKGIHQAIQLRHHENTWRQIPEKIRRSIEHLITNISPPCPDRDLESALGDLKDELITKIHTIATEHIRRKITEIDNQLSCYDPLDMVSASEIARLQVKTRLGKKIRQEDVEEWITETREKVGQNFLRNNPTRNTEENRIDSLNTRNHQGNPTRKERETHDESQDAEDTTQMDHEQTSRKRSREATETEENRPADKKTGTIRKETNRLEEVSSNLPTSYPDRNREGGEQRRTLFHQVAKVTETTDQSTSKTTKMNTLIKGNTAGKNKTGQMERYLKNQPKTKKSSP